MKNDENTVDTNEDQQDLPTVGGVRLETDSNGNGTEVGELEPYPSNITYHLIGIITIIFGVIVGIYLFVAFAEQQQMLFSTSKSELTFGEVVIAFGAAMIFIVPGVICIGIGKIIGLLNK